MTRQVWGPGRYLAGNEFGLNRRIKPTYFVLADPTKASVGEHLRYMRKRLQLTIEGLSKKSGLSHNVIARLERDETRKANPWVLGKILPLLADRFKETFPEAQGDPYDFLIPPTTFGGWLKNFRLRKALQLNELAKALRVNPYSVIRYESDQSKPDKTIRARLRQIYNLNGELDRFF